MQQGFHIKKIYVFIFISCCVLYLWLATIFGYTAPDAALSGTLVQNSFFKMGGFGNSFANFNRGMFGYLAYAYLPLLLLPVYRFYDDTSYSFRKIQLTCAYLLLFISGLILQALIFDSGQFGNYLKEVLTPYIGLSGVAILAFFLMVVALLLITKKTATFTLHYFGGTLNMALQSLKKITKKLFHKARAKYIDFHSDYIQRAHNRMVSEEYSEVETTTKSKYIFDEPLLEKPLDEYPRARHNENKESRSEHTANEISHSAQVDTAQDSQNNTQAKKGFVIQIKQDDSIHTQTQKPLTYQQYNNNYIPSITHKPRTQTRINRDDELLRRFQKLNLPQKPNEEPHTTQIKNPEEVLSFRLKEEHEIAKPLESFAKTLPPKPMPQASEWNGAPLQREVKTTTITKNKDSIQDSIHVKKVAYPSALPQNTPNPIPAIQAQKEDRKPHTKQTEYTIKIKPAPPTIQTESTTQNLESKNQQHIATEVVSHNFTSFSLQDKATNKEPNTSTQGTIPLETTTHNIHSIPQIKVHENIQNIPNSKDIMQAKQKLHASYKPLDMSFTQDKPISKMTQNAIDTQNQHNAPPQEILQEESGGETLAKENSTNHSEITQETTYSESFHTLGHAAIEATHNEDIPTITQAKKEEYTEEDTLAPKEIMQEESTEWGDIKEKEAQEIMQTKEAQEGMQKKIIEEITEKKTDNERENENLIHIINNRESLQESKIQESLIDNATQDNIIEMQNNSGHRATHNTQETRNEDANKSEIQIIELPAIEPIDSHNTESLSTRQGATQAQKRPQQENINTFSITEITPHKENRNEDSMKPTHIIHIEPSAPQNYMPTYIESHYLASMPQPKMPELATPITPQPSYNFTTTTQDSIPHQTKNQKDQQPHITIKTQEIPQEITQPASMQKDTTQTTHREQNHIESSRIAIQRDIAQHTELNPEDRIIQQIAQKKEEERESEQAIIHELNSINPQEVPETPFILPPLKLLQEPIDQDTVQDFELDSKIEKMLQIFNAHKIKGDIIDTLTGPVVTTFEFRPETDVKVSKILSHRNDLARILKAKSIRIQAPIPGKDVIGIQIPNSKVTTIYLREILQSREFLDSKEPLTIALGKDISGMPIVANLAKLPHLLVAGTTGSGKSVGVNAIILSLLYRNNPDDLKLMMIDPKQVEFAPYEDLPHLITPIINAPNKAIKALQVATMEMDRRYELFSQIKVKNILSYNEKASIKMPNFVIIIDELADLMITGGKEAEAFIARIAQMGRASGMHLIIATQRSSVNVITGHIKANLPSRISYRVGSRIDSKVILDEMGAEDLLGNGDGLFTTTNGLMRIHAPWVSEQEVEHIVDFIKAQREPQYDESFLAEKAQNAGNNGALSGEGGLVDKAKEIILQDNRTSISYIQRKLGIGYNKAASIIETLEREGFLSPPNSKGERSIL